MNKLLRDHSLQLRKIKTPPSLLIRFLFSFGSGKANHSNPFSSIIGIVAATEIEECKLCLKKRLSTPNDVKIRALQGFSRGV
jgi:hypothetical protein